MSSTQEKPQEGTTLSAAALAWQVEKEELFAEASRDPEVAVARADCPNACGWWTMAVSDSSQPDMANMEITVDTVRHIRHDCTKATPDQKNGMGPKPSH